jgi:DNA polymerase III subunit gamma/tau
MEEVSLYRKYRPHNFDNLVGQDHVKSTLINAFKANKVSHAYLFSGPRGTGKTSTARLVSKALNCQNPSDGFEPCNECEFCKAINDAHFIDLIEIDAASNRGIDEVRDLKEKIGFAPNRSKYKIYIIDEVHMMTVPAFNALLKTLEEPPEHAYFILATTEVHKIPETIISRCQRFDFRRINEKALMTRLNYIAQKEEIQAQESALELIIRYCNGGMRDAIGLLQQLTIDKKLSKEHVQEILGFSSMSLLTGLFDNLMINDSKNALKIVQDLHNQGSDLKQFLHEFINLLREKMLEAINEGHDEQMGRLLEMIDVFQEAYTKKESDIPQLPLEMAVVKITGNYENAVKENPVIEKPSLEKDLPITTKESAITTPPSPISDTPEEVSPLTISYLKEKWPRIMERIKTPSLKRSLSTGRPAIVEGVNVTLEFSTNFDREKIMEHDNRVEIETVINKLFNTSVKIASNVKELDLKSVVEEKKAPAVDNSNKITDQALEIFGGELLDD